MKDVVFSPEAIVDYEHWKATNSDVVRRIKRLLKDMTVNPYTGLGKPEKLKYDLSGKWSRRINSEHRIVYVVREDDIYVLALRYHYAKK